MNITAEVKESDIGAFNRMEEHLRSQSDMLDRHIQACKNILAALMDAQEKNREILESCMNLYPGFSRKDG